MIPTAKLLTLLVLLATVQIACTRNEQPMKVHEGGIPTSPLSAGTPAPAGDRGARPLLMGESKDGSEAALLTSDALSDPKKLALPETRAALSRLNKFILKSLQSGNSEQKLLEQYQAAALKGCDEALKGCTTLPFFKTDVSTYEIVRLIAQREQDLAKKYRLLRYAYDAVPYGQDTAALDADYLEQAAAYDKSLGDESGDKPSVLRKLHLELVAQILNTIAADPKRVLSQAVVDSFKAWNLDKSASEHWNEITEQLRLISVRRRELTAGKGEEMARELMKRPAGLESSIKSTLDRYPRAFRNLGLNTKLSPGVELFVLEALWAGVIDLKSADELIQQQIGQDARKAESVRQLVLDYARLRLAITVFEVQAKMTAFFTGDHNLTGDTVLEKGLNEAARHNAIWLTTHSKMALLKGIFDRSLRIVDNRLGADQKSPKTPVQKQLEDFFAGLNRNVKIMSTYPNMLLIAYQMAQLKFETKVVSWTGVINIDSAQVLTWFFDGIFGPWLAFSDDPMPLNSTEILSVFSFMFRTGLLDDAGISTESFLRLVASQYLDQPRSAIEAVLDNMNVRFDGSTDFALARKTCETIKKMPNGKITPLPMQQVGIDSLRNFTGYGIPRKLMHGEKTHNPLMTALVGVIAKDTGMLPNTITLDYFGMDEFYERVRLDYNRRVERLQTLSRLALAHVKDAEGEAVARGLSVKVDAILTPYTVVSAKFYEKMYMLNQEIIGCMTKLIRHEMDSQLFVLSELRKHFTAVHAKMKALRAASTDAQAAPALMQELNLSAPGASLPTDAPRSFAASLRHHESQLGYTKDYYRFSGPQLLLRVKQILEGGASPMRAPGTFRVSDSVETFNKDVRNWATEISYQENVASFVQVAMRKSIRIGVNDTLGKEGLLYWWDLMDMAQYLDYFHYSIASMLKAGKVPTKVCNGKPCEEKVFFGAKEAARFAIEIADILELTREWIDMLNTIGLDSRVGYDLFYKDVTMRSTGDEALGLLDNVFKHVRSGVLGMKGDMPGEQNQQLNPREKRINEAKTYFITMRGAGTHSFPAVGRFDRLFDDYYDDLVRREFEPLRDLIRESNRIEEDASSRGIRLPTWRFTVGRDWGKVPVLSRIQREGYRSDLYDLQRETQRPIPEDIAKP